MPVHRLRPTQPLDGGDLAERMERLRADAGRLAHEHTDLLIKSLAEAAATAEQIAGGGEAYLVGVREIARRTQGELQAIILNLRAVQHRSQ